MIHGIKYRVLEEASTEPVDISFFKQHARIDFNVDDSLIESYLIAAREHLEQWAQLSFGVRRMQLTAINLPKDYQLMYGPVASIETDGFTLLGDIVREGGKDVTIQYTTAGIDKDVIRVAICRYAAGLYAIRENIITNENGTPVNGATLQDEAKKMLQPFRNITLF